MVMAGFVPAMQTFLAGLSCRTALQDVMAGINPAITIVNRIGFAEVTADSYFFGAILLSAGFAASALASVAAASGLSMRSTLAVSRSFAT
jgi:hypothetical protein